MGGPRAGPLLGVGAALLLVVAVLLARGGTAAGEQDLARPAPPTATSPAGPSPGPPPPTVTDVGPLGTAGARLGPRPTAGEDSSGWLEAGVTSTDGRCALLRYSGARPELDVSGWQVGDRIVSVAVRWRGGAEPDVRSAWGTTFGDDLDAVDPRAPTTTYEEQPEGAAVPVRSVVTVVDGTEVVFSDIGSTSGISYIEVREPAGTGCRTDRVPGLGPELGDLPVLDADGRGPVRFGMPVDELGPLGLGPVPFGRDDPDLVGCGSWYLLGSGPEVGPGLAGLEDVLVRHGRVVGVRIAAGATAEGLAVGDPAGAVLDAYPELAVTGTDGDLLPVFPATLADGRRIDVATGAAEVMPTLVDAPVAAAEDAVMSLTLQTRPCRG